MESQEQKVRISVGDHQFIATLFGNDTAREVARLLPFEITMDEHNGNEKYYIFPQQIKGKSTILDRIETGDLMIWSSNTLVLFYNTSKSMYSYKTIGKVDDTIGLADALGTGRVMVRFELINTK